MTKLLQEKASVLADFTEHLNDVIANRDKFYISTLSTNQFSVFDYSTLVNRIETYSGINHDYVSDLLINASNVYNKHWENAFPSEGSAFLETENWYQKSSFHELNVTSFDSNLFIKFPLREQFNKQGSEALQVDFNIILKGILEKAKNILDKQLSGYRGSVFTSTKTDLRSRIRIFLRSLHTPNHDGKDEDSDRIVKKDRCNTISFLKKNSINGKEKQFARGGRLCYRQVRK
ncbi:hypothetical protein ACLOAU_04060 [Niabella sp. CJ426]|uniref:hypothetical protein n=1 Tax=Niabella sp. CJ426 TaxID=3393740 RepID=UPI003D03F457